MRWYGTDNHLFGYKSSKGVQGEVREDILWYLHYYLSGNSK